MRRISVLHIDDCQDFLELFSLFYIEWFDVTSLDNPLEAFDVIKTSRFDAFVIDYNMPQLNGLELLKQLKHHYPRIPVILYTGQGSEEIAREAFISGATDYFIKDISSFAHKEKLVNTVMNAVARTDDQDARYRSESMFHALFQNASDAIFLHRLEKLDENGVLVEVNDVACKLLGYTREEILKLTPRQLTAMNGEDERVHEVLDKLETRGASKFDMFLLARDGMRIPVEMNTQLFEFNGELMVLSIARDISERKKSEEELKAREKFFRNLYEEAPLAYHSLDEKGCLLDVNKAWLIMFGYSQEEVFNRRFSDFMTGEYQTLFPERFEKFLKNGETKNAEFEMIRKDGSHFIVSVTGKITRDELGGFMRTHCILVDVTRMHEAQRHLKEKNRELDDFAYRISHDLKNQIAMIQGFLETTRANPALFESKHEKLMDITRKLKNYIDTILSMSRAGRVIEDKKRFRIGDLLRTLFFTYKPNEVPAHLAIGNNLPEIYGDPKSIENMLGNLMDNATKYRDRTKDALRIQVSGEVNTENTFVTLYFKDNGIGFEEKYLEKLFNPGFTLAQNTGTGFGLAIVKKIVEAHGGTIRASSKGKNMGTEFVIQLPYR